jgi:hypothetical protein
MRLSPNAVLSYTLLAVLVTAFPLGGPAMAAGRPLEATLTGAAEVAGGDPDGSGTAKITLNQDREEVCWNITVQGISLASLRAHIHKAPVGANGPIVVPFFEADDVRLSGCVGADDELIKDIRKHPSDYYVNVHNADFPGGALRGQLSK